MVAKAIEFGLGVGVLYVGIELYKLYSKTGSLIFYTPGNKFITLSVFPFYDFEGAMEHTAQNFDEIRTAYLEAQMAEMEDELVENE